MNIPDRRPSHILTGLLLLAVISVAPTRTISAQTINDFMSKRFGMFIHFGPVTLRGTEIGWSRNQEVAQDDYDSLYREFNPSLFNADTWVRTAKDAGMKYLTITAKHHDGFLLWPSAISSYNISNSPFKRDIVGELAAACRRQGITFCIYFTVLDWHDPDYPIHSPHDSTKNVKGNMPRFVNTMKQELKEIVTKYHPYMLWFDGYWEKPWTTENGKEIYTFLKSLDRNLVVNNRLGKEMSHLSGNNAVGDFLTPEQQIGALNMTEPWESCITICNQWAWKPNDGMKSLKQCIQTLIRTAGGNGNLLFNVGPMMDGRMEARQIARLKEMGSWLKQYGEAIYDTHGGPYPPENGYATTRKGNKIYLTVMDRGDGSLTLKAFPPATGIKIRTARFLHGAEVPFTSDTEKGYRFQLPSTLPDPNGAVIVLELDGNAETIPVIH